MAATAAIKTGRRRSNLARPISIVGSDSLLRHEVEFEGQVYGRNYVAAIAASDLKSTSTVMGDIIWRKLDGEGVDFRGVTALFARAQAAWKISGGEDWVDIPLTSEERCAWKAYAVGVEEISYLIGAIRSGLIQIDLRDEDNYLRRQTPDELPFNEDLVRPEERWTDADYRAVRENAEYMEFWRWLWVIWESRKDTDSINEEIVRRRDRAFSVRWGRSAQDDEERRSGVASDSDISSEANASLMNFMRMKWVKSSKMSD